MNAARQYFHNLNTAAVGGWNRFWFTPSDPTTLCVIRILAGAMLFYTHLIWALNSNAFFEMNSWLNNDAMSLLNGSGYSWSHLWMSQSGPSLTILHVVALIVFAMMTLGLFTRMTTVLAFVITVSYANRAAPATFGLDQINTLLAMYLMLAPCGARFSIDRLLARRRAAGSCAQFDRSVATNVSIRLIQLHMCIIYLFAGLAKLKGPAWWNGTAIWGAIANLEYQSIDMTWLADWPIVVNLLSHATVVWEISYCVLIWNRLTRPIVLFLAIPIHLGIACCLGMMTFGTIMLVANVAFVSPQLLRSFIPEEFSHGRRNVRNRADSSKDSMRREAAAVS